MVREIRQKHIKSFERSRFGSDDDLDGRMGFREGISRVISNEIVDFFDKCFYIFQIFAKTQIFQKFHRQRTVSSEDIPEIYQKIELFEFVHKINLFDIE